MPEWEVGDHVFIEEDVDNNEYWSTVSELLEHNGKLYVGFDESSKFYLASLLVNIKHPKFKAGDKVTFTTVLYAASAKTKKVIDFGPLMITGTVQESSHELHRGVPQWRYEIEFDESISFPDGPLSNGAWGWNSTRMSESDLLDTD